MVGYAFGYIEADLDTAHPCDPVAGWPVVGFTGPDLNCLAVGLELGCSWDDVCDALEAPPGCQPRFEIPRDLVPCPDIGLYSVLGFPEYAFCQWDGMDTLDAETIVLHNWGSGLLVVLRVDAAGVLTMPDAYATPPYPPGQSCGLLPVNHPVIDRTRGRGGSAVDVRLRRGGSMHVHRRQAGAGIPLRWIDDHADESALRALGDLRLRGRIRTV